MALTRRAKTLTDAQFRALLHFVETETLFPDRNRVIVLLAFKAGLRAKEVGGVTWGMLTDAEGELKNTVALENLATKGNSGREIPLHKQLRDALAVLLGQARSRGPVGPNDFVVTFRRGSSDLVTRSNTVQFLFKDWFRRLGFERASSHSGRRTFITTAARRIFEVGGSLVDVQRLAGHSSVSLTQLYVDTDADAQRKVIALI